MSRRIDIELTSDRGDGTWTWRAAGAKLPKGVLEATLLYDGAQIGDIVKADADFLLDGIEIIGVLAPKVDRRKEPELLEIVGSGRDDPLVTTTLAPKGGRSGRGGDDRRPRRDGGRSGRNDRDRRPKARGDRRGGERKGGERKGRERRDGGDRPARPKARRLKAGRAHRRAAVAELPELQRPLAEELLRGGLASVRTIIENQNEAAKAASRPQIRAERLLPLAEELLTGLRIAEWHDRATAALAGVEELDLRDLRSVVVAAEQSARTDEARALADQLRDALARRVDHEHQQWLSELAQTLADGRTVRALRLSSRPPKAGAPLPADMAERLTDAANAGLTADTSPDRFATVLDAVALSPVRLQVRPESIPSEPGDELLAAVARLGDRIPDIAAMFGVTPAPPPRRGRGRGRGGRKGSSSAPPPPAPSPPAAPAPAEPTADTAPPEAAPAEPTADTAAPPAAPAPAEPTADTAPPEAAPAEPTADTAAPPAAPAPAEPTADTAAPPEAAPAEPTADTAAPPEAAPAEPTADTAAPAPQAAPAEPTADTAAPPEAAPAEPTADTAAPAPQAAPAEPTADTAAPPEA